MFGSSFCLIMENIDGVFSARCNVILPKAWHLSLIKQLNKFLYHKSTYKFTYNIKMQIGWEQTMASE